MTRTLEFSPELENRLQVLATQRGASVEVVLVEAAEQLAQDAQNAPRSELSARQRAALAGYGKYAGLGFGSDDLIRERREEAAREIRQAAENDRLPHEGERKVAA